MVRIGTIWDRTLDVLAGRGAILFSLAMLFVFLPNVIGAAFSSYAAPGSGLALVASLVSLVSVLLLIFGMLAITAVASDPAVDRARAISIAGARFGPALAVMLVIMVALTLAVLPPGIVLAGAGATSDPATGMLDMSAVAPSAAAVAGVLALVLLIVGLWVSAKLAPLFAVVVNERRGLGALRRSFALTRGAALRLLGALLLFGVVALVLLVAVTSVTGIVFRLLLGAEAAGTVAFLTAIASSAVTALVTVVQVVFYAQFYVAAAGARNQDAPVA